MNGLISACHAGENCKYNGGSNQNEIEPAADPEQLETAAVQRIKEAGNGDF